MTRWLSLFFVMMALATGCSSSTGVSDGSVVDASPDGASTSDASLDAAPSDADVDASPSDASADASPSDASADASPSDASVACDADGNVTRAFVVRTLKVAPQGIGANIDGLDNSSTPNSVAGCRRQDAAGGIDNEAYAGDQIPYANGAPSAVAQSGVTSGTISLTFTISSWNGTANDPCIELALSGQGVTGTSTIQTSIAGSVIDVSLPDAGWDITGTYSGKQLTIPLRGLHPHLLLDGTLTELVLPTTPNASNTSFLAGYFLYDVTGAGATADDFRAKVMQFVSDLGLSAYSATVDNTFLAHRDLHTLGGLRPCMMVGTSGTTVDADSVSAAFLLSTNAP